MRVLTVKQPWAWALVHGGKDIENRVTSLGEYRGPVAIHAGLTLADVDDKVFDIPAYREALRNPSHETMDRFHARGMILGVATLVGNHRDGDNECTDRINAHVNDALERVCSPWAMRNHYHLEFQNVVPIRPLAAQGRLSLWRPSAGLHAEILERIAETVRA